jgi:outer membrane protein OmpA-like peptidoglycan-associated protein
MHAARIAVASAGLLMVCAAQAPAQSVQTFDEAPSVDTLRNILIPESAPDGASRRIIVPGRDTDGGPVQRASAPATAAPPAQAPASAPASSNQQAAPQAAPQPATQTASTAAPGPSTRETADQHSATAVGFHINFALNSAAIPPSADSFLDRIADLMKQEPQLKLRVEGHTDASGSDEYNLHLSQARAESVEQALAKRGVPADRLTVIGKGKREPLVPDAYDATNRRVQFVRL